MYMQGVKTAAAREMHKLILGLLNGWRYIAVVRELCSVETSPNEEI
jgi:hypothetical protein